MAEREQEKYCVCARERIRASSWRVRERGPSQHSGNPCVRHGGPQRWESVVGGQKTVRIAQVHVVVGAVCESDPPMGLCGEARAANEVNAWVRHVACKEKYKLSRQAKKKTK